MRKKQPKYNAPIVLHGTCRSALNEAIRDENVNAADYISAKKHRRLYARIPQDETGRVVGLHGAWRTSYKGISMGQYWKPVNLTKKEFINPHELGAGLKLWEQLANPGIGQALIILLAAMPVQRGGGDLNEDPIIGRWAGDAITLVGDYAEDSDFPDSPCPFSEVYGACQTDDAGLFKDITADVARVIERELDGKFVGNGWKEFIQDP